MTLFLFTFVVFVLSGLGMAVGVLCGRPPIPGSCGGVQVGGSCGRCRRCERAP